MCRQAGKVVPVSVIVLVSKTKIMRAGYFTRSAKFFFGFGVLIFLLLILVSLLVGCFFLLPIC